MKADFAIVTALPEERDAVRKALDLSQRYEIENQTYYFGTLLDRDTSAATAVVMTMLEFAGNTTAAAVASMLVERWKPSEVLMVGIAGGVKDAGVQLGDVVVGRQIIYYELGKTKPSQFAHDYREEQADPFLLNQATNLESKDWLSRIRTARPMKPKQMGTEPEVLFGPIACGEKVITDPGDVAELQSFSRAVMAVETESWGVVSGLRMRRVAPGFLAIRGVCDFADPKKNDEWHEYAAEAAAQFARDLIEYCAPAVRQALESEGLAESAAQAISLREEEVSEDESQTVRRELLSTLVSDVADSHPAAVWLWGLPGAGKTRFAYALARRVRPENPVFHIVSRLDQDPHAFIDLVAHGFPDEWWHELVSDQAPEQTGRTLKAAISALVNSNATVILEHADPFLESGDWNASKSLVDAFVRLEGAPRLICTGLQEPPRDMAGFACRQVTELSLPEARELIRTRVGLNDDYCERIWARYRGHTLAVYHVASAIEVAFGQQVTAAQLDRLLEKIPADVESLLASRIEVLSVEQQGWLAAMAAEVNGVAEAAVPPEHLEPLTGAGLVNRLPALHAGRSLYAVHQLVGEVALSSVPDDVALTGRRALYQGAYDKGMIEYGPRLAVLNLEAGNRVEAQRLVLSEGRWWIEAVGIDHCLPAFSRAAGLAANDAPTTLYLGLLYGVGLLFSGSYSDAETQFERVLATEERRVPRPRAWRSLLSRGKRIETKQVTALVDLLGAEAVECQRRLGNVDAVVSGLPAIQVAAANARSPLSSLEAEARGVAFLLIGHLLRQVGQYRAALEAYEHGETLLSDHSARKACDLELQHCQYAASMCRLLLGQEFAPFVSTFRMGPVQGSEFLQGLWQLLLAQKAVSAGDYQRGSLQAEEAREHFRRFQSPSYALRAECVRVCAAVMGGDEIGAEEALSAVSMAIASPKPATALAGVGLQALSVRQGSQDSAARTRSLIQPLLASGAMVTARSAAMLLRVVAPGLYATEFEPMTLRQWTKAPRPGDEWHSMFVECCSYDALIKAVDGMVGPVGNGHRAFMLE